MPQHFDHRRQRQIAPVQHRQNTPTVRYFTPTTIALSVRNTLLAIAVAASVSGLPKAFAADPIPVTTANKANKIYAVPAGPLGEALSNFAASAGVSVQLDARLVEGRETQGLRGSYTVQAGFARLLDSSGLEVVERSSGTYVLKSAPAPFSDGEATLRAVRVTSDSTTSSDLPKAFAGGQVATASRMGVLGNVDLFDTPFSTQSFTEAFVQDQQSRRVADIISVDPSVRSAMAEYGDSETYIIRGFPLFVNQVGVNGLYGMTEGRRITPEFYERVDVLKGPASMLNGITPFGVVGGNINLTSKRAGDEPLTRLTGSYISDSQFGAHLDLARRFGDSKEWGVRLNVLTRDGDTPISNQEDQMKNGALAVDYRGDKLKASLDLANQERLTNGYSANIVYNQGFALPRPPENDKNFVNDWEHIDTNAKYWMTRAEYEFSPALSAYANYGQSEGDEEYFYAGSQARRFINSAGDFTARAGGFRGSYEVETYELGLRGLFMLGDISNHYAVSYSDFSRSSYGSTVNATAVYTGNVYNTPTLAKPTVNYGVIPQNGDLQLNSVGLVNTFGFMEDMVLLTVGARKQNLYSGIFTTGVKTNAYDDSKVTPAAALLVKLGSYSLYTNYSEGLAQGATAPGGTSNQGTLLPPSVTKQYEGGVKFNAGTFGLTAALFQISQPSTFTNSANFFVADGEQRNRGLEFSTFGQPLRGVRLLGGVTLIDAKQTKTLNGLNDGNDAIGVPRVNVVLNGEYDIFGITGLTFTGRINAFSSAQADAGNTQSIPGWTTLDAGTRYVTQISGKAVTLRANVTNLTDKNYWNSVSRSFITMGAPRTALLSATIDF